jgi:hypothetical protein
MTSPTDPTIFHGNQFLEYFLAYLKSHPTCEVRIVTYLLRYQPNGVAHDIIKQLNNHRSSAIYVGITSFVSRRSIEREVKKYAKTFRNVSFQFVENDHRKIFYTFDRKTNAVRAWLGSQNLHDSYTANIVMEATSKEIPFIVQEVQNFNITIK